jgi:cytoskeletal protein RodZ
MKTVGAILTQARVKRKLTLAQVSRLTKISRLTLKAIEKNRFDKLPSSTYIKGFIRNYCQVVGLDPEKTLAVFRRDLAQAKTTKVIPPGLAQPLNRPHFQVTPRFTSLVLILSFLVLLLAYLGVSFWQLYSPPSLSISSPSEGEAVTSPVLIKGKTDHDATLTLDGKVLNLEPDGRFTTVYSGPPGTAELRFRATSRRQKSSQLTLHLIITN